MMSPWVCRQWFAELRFADVSKSIYEMEDLIKMSDAIVVNTGTLDDAFMTLGMHACKLANQYEKPIILDPVGAGASAYRTESCLRLMQEHRIAIVRGNAGEIMALAGLSGATKGVDSNADSSHATASAQVICSRYNAAVVISGEKDFVIDKNKVSQFARGAELMTLVTGTGCLLSAVVGAFHAAVLRIDSQLPVQPLFYGGCGELAAGKSKSPGSFKTFFIDALHKIPMRDDYEVE